MASGRRNARVPRSVPKRAAVAVLAVVAVAAVVLVGQVVAFSPSSQARTAVATPMPSPGLASSTPSSPASSPASSPTSSPTAGSTSSPATTPPAPAPASVSAPAVAPPVRRIVALGDSVPAGTNCGCTPYVDLVASRLARAQGTPVSAGNLAVSGQTSSGLLAALGSSDLRARVRSADLVVVTIGANDFDGTVVADDACAAAACYSSDLAALRESLDQILDTVHALAGDDAQVVVTGYWNVFLDGAVGRAQGQAYVRNSDALTRAANATIEAVARADDAAFVDVYAPFKGDGSRDDTTLLAPDGDHPSAQGHTVIATAITRAVAQA